MRQALRKAQTMKPTTIYLERRLDALRNDWYEWTCTADMPDGTSREGTVQAAGDGEMIAEDTFEPMI